MRLLHLVGTGALVAFVGLTSLLLHARKMAQPSIVTSPKPGVAPSAARPFTRPPALVPAAPGPPPPGTEGEEARSAPGPERRPRTFTDAQELFRRETADTAWSARATEDIRRELTAAAGDDATIKSLACGSSLCELVLVHRSADAQRELPFRLTAGPFASGVMFAYAPELLETRVLVGRAGQPFPPSQPRSP
jgi:hypothetical protein